MLNAPTIAPDDQLVTLPQVARELGITRATAKVWALSGRFRAREVAGRTVVRRADLEEFKASIIAAVA
jgi:hypothetical protein